MTKGEGRPEDIPEEVWNRATSALANTLVGNVADPLRPHAIARALMTVIADEREACAVVAQDRGNWHIDANAMNLPVELSEVIAKDRAKVAFGIRDDIRKRGES